MKHTELFCIDYAQMTFYENGFKHIIIQLLLDENNNPKIRSIRKIDMNKSVRKLIHISSETYKKLLLRINKVDICINPKFKAHGHKYCTSFTKSDGGNTIRCQWWDKAPNEWMELEKVIKSIIEKYEIELEPNKRST